MVNKKNKTNAKRIAPGLLEMLVCPVTKARLIYDEKANELISEHAGLAFPVRNGVPILLVEEARELHPGNE